MTSVDTNVLVRLLIADDQHQAAEARRLFESGPIWIAKTVLLETAWVLRSSYELDPDTIREVLTKTLGLKNVYMEDSAAIAAALTHSACGIDIADAIHLASRARGTTFVTFDKALVRRADRAGITGVVRI